MPSAPTSSSLPICRPARPKDSISSLFFSSGSVSSLYFLARAAMLSVDGWIPFRTIIRAAIVNVSYEIRASSAAWINSEVDSADSPVMRARSFTWNPYSWLTPIVWAYSCLSCPSPCLAKLMAEFSSVNEPAIPRFAAVPAVPIPRKAAVPCCTPSPFQIAFRMKFKPASAIVLYPPYEFRLGFRP